MKATLEETQVHEVGIEDEEGRNYKGRITGTQIAYEERGEVSVFLTEDERVIVYDGKAGPLGRHRRRRGGVAWVAWPCHVFRGDARARHHARSRPSRDSESPLWWLQRRLNETTRRRASGP